MSKTVEQMQKQIELFLNEQSADLKVFRVTLQCFLLNMVGNAPNGLETLAAMKQQVLQVIGNTEQNPADPDGSERHKQLTMMRAEQLFQEIEEPIRQAAGKFERKDAN